MDFLLGHDDGIAEHIVDQGSVTSDTRLGIYRNAYQVRLKGTLETDHELLGLYLGDDLFEQMAAGYTAQHPSRYRSLRQFSDHLPQYLEQHAPFSEHPVLACLARFERLLLAAFDATDGPRLTQTTLQQLPPEHWPEMALRFHPSVQFFQAEWNAVAIWQALKVEKTPPPAEQLEAPASWLVWRNQERLTEFRFLPEDELHLLTAMLAGANFAELCEQLLNYHTEEQVGQVAVGYLLSWIQQGLLLDTLTDQALG